MKRIAIFCDGTWNSADSKPETNVVRLFTVAVASQDIADDIHPLYHEGVGTGRGRNRVERFLDRLCGGAFGWGLTRNIRLAYEDLAKVFEPGDQIYLFGFSRGAYTARSLAGLIRNCGIPTPENIERSQEAVNWYRDRGAAKAPYTDESHEFRMNFSPQLTTGKEEIEWRKANGKPLGMPLNISYMGIWDTVGALGVPGFLGTLAKFLNMKYTFHDTDLSSMVKAGRHAVSIDERRRTYEPTLWNNLAGLSEGREGQPYQQKWFPGVHGVVGGGGPDIGLTMFTLAWIADGAKEAGLQLDEAALVPFLSQRNYQGALRHGALHMLSSLISRDRRGPKTTDELAEVTLDRLAFGGKGGAVYDPATLSDLKQQIAALPPRENPTRFA
ncbi:DUF2235 domain-containing protein [Qingshengfaniella alkalisoli]|nr:DUF2235 domain-containing protein [Qingshengfaniella alkalisoli]